MVVLIYGFLIIYYKTDNYYSFSKPDVCFTWLQTTKQRAIMSSAGLQIHLQTHGSQSNANKHDQLTNKIALFSRHTALYIYLVLQDDERNLRVVKSVFGGQLLYDPFKTNSILEMSFNMEIFYSGSSQNSDLGQEQLNNMEESAEADNTKRATKWGLNPKQARGGRNLPTGWFFLLLC